MGICIGANGLKGQLRQHQLTLAAKAPFDFSLAILFFFLEVLYVSLFLWDLSYIFCLLPYLLHIFLLLFLWQILLNNECWMQRSTVVYIIINITGLCGYIQYSQEQTTTWSWSCFANGHLPLFTKWKRTRSHNICDHGGHLQTNL